MENSTKIVIALAAGAVAGIAIGLLLAPDKGSETRKQVAEKSRGFLDDLLDKIEAVMDDYQKNASAAENEEPKKS